MMQVLKQLFDLRPRSAERAQVNTASLLADRSAFNDFIYTPAAEAIEELKRRQSDLTLATLPDAPAILGKGNAMMVRHLITPNYELRRFVSIADGLELKPVFLEYSEDKFTSNNDLKYHLAMMYFYAGQDRNGGPRVETINVIDFNTSNGKRFCDVQTLWGEALPTFHHQLFTRSFPQYADAVVDISDWFKANGGSSSSYYEALLTFAVRRCILFDNFSLSGLEYEFTKNIFLPAFVAVCEKWNLKPLIVALEPTEIEGDRFWSYYPFTDKQFVMDKMEGVKYT